MRPVAELVRLDSWCGLCCRGVGTCIGEVEWGSLLVGGESGFEPGGD